MTTAMDSLGRTRIEKDSMGEMAVPADVLYGASTQRAVLNFPISGRAVPDEVIRAYAMLKRAAARANESLGKLPESKASAIEAACGEILGGLEDRGGIARHFPVDVFQTGSGTSTNMNANEVISNLVCLANGAAIGSSKDPEYLRGDAAVHPNDHVNMGQSSNDTFPTAMHVAAAVAITERLLPAVRALADSLESKAQSWDDVMKIG
ncbi:MAG: lyase family protein, partial [Planctomycetota bacterium]